MQMHLLGAVSGNFLVEMLSLSAAAPAHNPLNKLQALSALTSDPGGIVQGTWQTSLTPTHDLLFLEYFSASPVAPSAVPSICSLPSL
jgi:hypothetical protein